MPQKLSEQSNFNPKMHLTTKASSKRNAKIPLLRKTTPQIEEKLLRDERRNELNMPLSSNEMKKLLYVPLDFENSLNLDLLIDFGFDVRATAESEMFRIKQRTPIILLKIKNPLKFWIQVANGQLEKPIATTTLNFDIGDGTFAEHFVEAKKPTRPINRLPFSVIIDTTNGFSHFSQFTMQVKSANSVKKAKSPPVLSDNNLNILPMTTKTITAFVDHPSFETQRLLWFHYKKITETAVLPNSFSMSAITDKKLPMKVTNTTKLSDTVRKKTEITEFSVVTLEQSQLNKQVDTAILSMIPQGYSELTTYLIELPKTNKPEQQSSTF